MIIAMLRVKNEARWIDRVLKSIQGVCDEIHIFDDHSEDGTAEICDRFATVYRSPFSGLDEARDKNWLLDRIEERGIPGVILCIDGDEELEPDGDSAIKTAVSRDGSCWSLKVAYLWNDPQTIRVDRVYGRFERASMWRHRRGLRFPSTGNGGNFHCGNVPAPMRRDITRLPVKLLHYGYMQREDRIRKYEWYNAQDPRNRVEDCYRHMVIGDIFPAESRFEWAGPLELRTL